MADDVVGKLVFTVETDTKDAKKGIDDFNDSMRESQEVAKKTDSEFGKASEGISLKAVAIATAVGTAVVKLGKAITEATGEIEEGRANIVNATGATGEALEGLMESAKAVFAQNEQSFDEVSRAIGEINTRFGETGEALESMTDLFLDFADATGQDVQQSVIGVSQAMNKWNIEAKDLPSVLDKLTVAGQKSGVSVATLTTNLTANAGTLQSMGYTFDEAVAMLSKFEEQGIESNSVIMAMKKSFEDSAKAGTDARTDWENLLDSIANATDETEANSLAVEAFGSRIATDMVSALRNGKLNFDDYTEAIENSTGALQATDEASKTTADKIQTLKNEVKVALGEMGAKIAPIIEKTLPTLSSLFNTVLSAITPVISAITEVANVVLPLLAGAIEAITHPIQTFIDLWNDFADTRKAYEVATGTVGVEVTAEEVTESEEDFLKRMEEKYGPLPDRRQTSNGHPLLSGSDYIPSDNYPALLHKGEAVLNPSEAERFRDMGGMYGLEQIASIPLGLEAVSSVRVDNNLTAVLEIDGTQLGVAVLKNIDNASQFVLR